MSQKINDHFLLELYKAALTSRGFFDIVSKHLKYHFIPQEEYKTLFQKMVQQYEVNQELPTIGSLAQHFNDNENVLKLLHKLRNINVSDTKDTLLSTFEKFLVDRQFIDLYVKIGTLHNEGKQDKAIALLAEESTKIASFCIKDSYYVRVFQDYGKRQVERQNKSRDQEAFKIPFSIHGLDYITRGGMSLGTSALFMVGSSRSQVITKQTSVDLKFV